MHCEVVLWLYVCENGAMARGWESKDVEAQVEQKKTVAENQSKAQKTAEQVRRDSERRDLQLSRTRIQNELESATNPNHRKSLEAALAHLDSKIEGLKL
jgi:hypothetical protein